MALGTQIFNGIRGFARKANANRFTFGGRTNWAEAGEAGAPGIRDYWRNVGNEFAEKGAWNKTKVAGKEALSLGVGSALLPFNLGAAAITTAAYRAPKMLWKDGGKIGKGVLAVGGAAGAVGAGYAVLGSSGNKGQELPPEMLETQAALNENQQVLDGMMQQQAMMQPQMQQMPPQVMAQQAANDPYNQAQSVVGDAAYQGQLAANEQTLGQG